MIKHIVCFKLKENSETARLKAAEILRSMEGKVPQIRQLEVGCDFLRSPRSYDVVVQVTLENAAALETYQADAYHCEVVKTHMHAVTEHSVAIDYAL